MSKIIIHIKRNCAEIKTPIPKGIEIVIRDYDVEDTAADGKDEYGPYVEHTHTDADNMRRL
jgi:hypothetical protein